MVFVSLPSLQVLNLVFVIDLKADDDDDDKLMTEPTEAKTGSMCDLQEDL